MFDCWTCGGEARGDGGKEMERCLTGREKGFMKHVWQESTSGMTVEGRKKRGAYDRANIWNKVQFYHVALLHLGHFPKSPNTNLMVALEGKAGISSHQVIGIQVCTINITIKWRTNPSRKWWHIVFHRISENFLPAKQSISSGHQGYLNKIHFSLDQKGAT